MIRVHMGTLLGIACVLCAAAHADTTPKDAADKPAVGVTVAVADFSGPDKDLGRFLADTLLTDLAQSKQLVLVERAQIGKTLTELKLQSGGLTEPSQVKRLGRLIGADRLIVGSYFVQDNRMLINARLLDVGTGRLMPNGGANVEGGSDDVLPLVRRLAQRLHRRVTGADLPFAAEEAKTKPLPETSATFDPSPSTSHSDVPPAPDYESKRNAPDPPAEQPIQDVLDSAPRDDATYPPPSASSSSDPPFQTRIIYYSPSPVYAASSVGLGFPLSRRSFPTRATRFAPARRLRSERAYALPFHPRQGGFRPRGGGYGRRRR